jgi:hypothetical protein
MRVMDDLDFSKPAGAPKPAAPASAPIYVPAIARAFFESVGKEEAVAAGTVFFAENEKASRTCSSATRCTCCWTARSGWPPGAGRSAW